jgi:hypothetical protein
VEAYKILLKNVEIDVPDEYKPYIMPQMLEVVSGVNAKLRITIKNISEEAFPGGRVEKWSVEEHGAAVAPGTLLSELLEEELLKMRIPRLEPNAEHQIERDFTFTVVGITEVKLKISSEDKKPVLHFRHVRETGRDELVFYLHVLDRGALKTLIFLNRLIEKLEGLK